MVFAMSVSSCGGAARRGVFAARNDVVHVEQRLLLPLGQPAVGEDGQLDGADLAVVEVEDPGADVERLRRDAQPFASCWSTSADGLAQPTFDLAEVRVRDTGLLGELPQRQLRREPLLAEVVPERLDGLADSELGHVPHSANSC